MPPRRTQAGAGWSLVETALRSWGLACCALALPALASGQSLGDAARKERQQRKKTAAAVRVVTEDDLAANKGQLANDPGAAGPGSTQETRETRRPAEARVPIGPIPASTLSEEEYWRARAQQARDSLAYAKRRYKSIERQIRIGQPAAYDQNGRRVITSIHTMKAVADEAEADVRAAEKALADLREEARRAGAHPGWLRE